MVLVLCVPLSMPSEIIGKSDFRIQIGKAVAIQSAARLNLNPRNLKSDIPMVKKLLHTRYRVSDLEKTIVFYRDVLGLEMTRRSKSPR